MHIFYDCTQFFFFVHFVISNVTNKQQVLYNFSSTLDFKLAIFILYICINCNVHLYLYMKEEFTWNKQISINGIVLYRVIYKYNL